MKREMTRIKYETPKNLIIEEKQMYILDENKELQVIDKYIVPDNPPKSCKFFSAFETYVQIPDAPNYWISNYGQCVNNYKRSDPKKYYYHKKGYVHITYYEKDVVGNVYKRDSTLEKLVARMFLHRYKGRNRIWHKDNDRNNNWYKNLIYVTEEDYLALVNCHIEYSDLKYGQEYYEYKNRTSQKAHAAYSGMIERCKKEGYEETEVCQEWVDNPDLFIKWYLENYYEVEGESMAVDKDLFGDSSIYSPDTCCILPQTINTLLSNCVRPYYKTRTEEYKLPMCVYLTEKGTYAADIYLLGTGTKTTLSEWDTPEEAFEEYKTIKIADIRTYITKHFINTLPQHIYKKLMSSIVINPY